MALRRLLAAAVLALLACPIAHAANEVMILGYHEVESDRAAVLSRTAVRASELAAQFAWLRDHGWVAVSLQQVLDSRQGGKPLPAKAVLLTIDDGKRDTYTRVFPLLRLFQYPAVVALVGSWLEVAADGVVDYDGTPVPRSEFVSWDEVREMQRSGLVEIASHSYDLHRGVLANPQGNTQPAAISRVYQAGQYETDAMYLERLRADLTASRNLITRQTGVAPRVIVWPYGRSNRAAQELAAELGMLVGFVLERWFQYGANASRNAGTLPHRRQRRRLVARTCRSAAPRLVARSGSQRACRARTMDSHRRRVVARTRRDPAIGGKYQLCRSARGPRSAGDRAVSDVKA